jgi:hypothetical protein
VRPAVIPLASLVLAALTAGAGVARSEHARASFTVGTTVVDACAVTLDDAAINAACTPGALARVAPAKNGLASGVVSLVRGGAPMRVASAVDGRTQVITFSF